MSEERTETAAHCEIGPSTLPARVICPCHDPDHAPNADAQSGTRSHKVVEAHLTAAQSCTPPKPDMMGVTESPEMIGLKAADSYLPDTTDDEISRGIWGANTIMRLRDETAPGAYIYTEQRVTYEPWDDVDKLPEVRAALVGKFGTVDAFWRSRDGGTLYIADYKTYATGDSEKCYAPQGAYYAALLQGSEGCSRAVFFVVAAGDRTVAQYAFDIAEAKAQTAATIRRVMAVKPGGLFQTGEEARLKCGKPSKWCATCAHKADCPAISRAVDIVSGGGILEKPLAVRMAVVPVLESFCKGVKAEVRAVLDKGERVFDAASGIEYGFAERRGKSKLKNLRGLAESVVGYGVTPDEFAAAVSISKTAVDGLLKAVDEREGRKVKKSDREAVYVGYFTEPCMERYVKRIS